MKTIFPVLLLGVLALCGCASLPPPQGDQPPVAQTQHIFYLLQPLDSVLVTPPDKTVATSLQIDPTGLLTLPDGGESLKMANIPTDQAASEIETRWKGAHVASFNQFRGTRISVLGEVQRPANLPLADTPMRVMDAVAAAGGFTSLANLHHVTLMRENADQVQIYQLDLEPVMQGENVSANLLLEPGDVITVGRSFL